MPKFFSSNYRARDRAAVQRGLALLGSMAKEAYSPYVRSGKGTRIPASKQAWRRKYQTRSYLRSKAGKNVYKGY